MIRPTEDDQAIAGLDDLPAPRAAKAAPKRLAAAAAAPASPGAPQLLNVAPALIKPHSENLRHDVGDVTELADSIREQGILEPLIVAPSGQAKSPYLLIAGHRRLAAAKVAGVDQVPVVVRRDLDTLQAQLEAMLTENGHRKGLSDVEEGEGYQQLLTFPGYTTTKVAKATGRSASYVRDRLKLGKLGNAVRDRVHAGQVGIADAVALAEFADDDEAYPALEQYLGTPNWAWALQRARQKRDDTKAAKKALQQLKDDGITVIDRPANFPRETRDTVAPLRWALYPGYQLGIDPADHADCPGHAAITPNSADVVYVCTQATLRHRQVSIDDEDDNRDASVPGGDHGLAVVPPDRDRLQAEREAWYENLRTAAALRSEFLRAFIDGRQLIPDGVRPAVRRTFLQLHLGAELYVDDAWLQWTGITVDTEDRDLEEIERAAFEALYAEATSSPTDRVLLGATAAIIEPSVCRGGPDSSDAHRYQAWFFLLEELGYQLSQFETDRLMPSLDTGPADPDDAGDERAIEDVVETL